MRFVEAKRPPTRFSKKCPSYSPVRGSFLRVFHMAPPRAQFGVGGGSGEGGRRENFQFFCPGISRPEAAPFLLPPILRGRFWPRNSGTAAGGFFFCGRFFLLSCCFFFACLRVASCRLAPLFFFSPARGAWLRSRNVFCCISRFAALPLAEVLLQRAWSLAHVLLCAAASSFLPRFCSEASSPYSSKVCVVVAA